jgi:hypothetical protein
LVRPVSGFRLWRGIQTFGPGTTGPGVGRAVTGISNCGTPISLLLILDDLQWADDASLNLLFHLGRRLTGSRVLILGSYRTGENFAGQQAARHGADEARTPENLILELTRQYGDIQVRLDQASPAEGRAFIDAILDLEPNRLGEAFRKDLYLHTRGHPLFTIEILHSIRQNQNILLDGAGYWVENRSSPPARRPARVEAVIEQRLARLNPLQRELLNVASVEGEWFTAEIVANVLGLDSATALKSFTHDLGQQHHMVQEQGQLYVRLLSLFRFQFYHMLIQEYLYSQLIPGEKRRLHRRMAEELEKILSEPERGRTSMHETAAISEEIVQPEYLDTWMRLVPHCCTIFGWVRIGPRLPHMPIIWENEPGGDMPCEKQLPITSRHCFRWVTGPSLKTS